MNLSNSIIPDSSTFDVNNRKLELKLKKEVENFNWVSIDRAKVKEVASNVVPSYPTSAKVKKDWNNVEKEINQELANDAKNDPNEGMMRLFREIYGNANEETRRAMIKSFQTSGGTVLSTDWNEVKEKDYEGRDRPDAPKGQEWRKNEV
jgi:suppressor of G2 allele of SKP1